MLSDNGYFKQGNHIYVNHFKNIVLFYSKSDCKKKRPEVFNELLRIGDMHKHQATPSQLIYGCLAATTGSAEPPVLLYNSVINIMSGESLFRYLFDDYDSIISKISDEINSQFNIPQNEVLPSMTEIIQDIA